jgi:hypothetical protein
MRRLKIGCAVSAAAEGGFHLFIFRDFYDTNYLRGSGLLGVSAVLPSQEVFP